MQNIQIYAYTHINALHAYECHVYVCTYKYDTCKYVSCVLYRHMYAHISIDMYTYIYRGFIHSHYWPGFESLLKIWNIILYATILNSNLNSSLPSIHLAEIILFLRTFLTYTVVFKLWGWYVNCGPSAYTMNPPHVWCAFLFLLY